MKGKLLNLTIGLNGRQQITVEVLGDFSEKYKQLNDSDVTVEIKKYRNRRSINANNYAWSLMEKLANAVGRDKELVYKDMLCRYGSGDTYLDEAGNECKVIFSLRKDIPPELVARYYAEVGRSELNGQTFIHYRSIKGSSEYDTKEMAHFIDGIVSECKDLDIETATPEELARYKDEWGR